MNKKTEQRVNEIYDNADCLKKFLRKQIWAPMTYMLIPSVLKTADENIEFLEKIKTKKASALCEELIELRKNFHRETDLEKISEIREKKINREM